MGLRKIIAGAIAENVASVAVLKKLGFKQEWVLRQDIFVDGEYRDVICMGMIREAFYKFAHESSTPVNSRV